MDPRLLSEYFKKCFVAVDGLWFMMLEETDSFEKALELDKKVWEVLPKIQARKIKELFEIEEANKDDLRRALKFKLEAEDFVSELQHGDSGMKIIIKKCPWLALLRKAKREHLAEKISDAICAIEYPVFAGQFVEGLNFDIVTRRCSGDEVCTFLLKLP